MIDTETHKQKDEKDSKNIDCSCNGPRIIAGNSGRASKDRKKDGSSKSVNHIYETAA
jgi:hypothetical protein